MSLSSKYCMVNLLGCIIEENTFTSINTKNFLRFEPISVQGLLILGIKGMTVYLSPEFWFIPPGSRVFINLINFKMYSFGYIKVKYMCMEPPDDKVHSEIFTRKCSIHYKADVTVVVLYLLLYNSHNVNLQYFSVTSRESTMMEFFTITRSGKGLSLATKVSGQVLHLQYQQVLCKQYFRFSKFSIMPHTHTHTHTHTHICICANTYHHH
jgi:hypothetical protein